jgi:hypothetical protein
VELRFAETPAAPAATVPPEGPPKFSRVEETFSIAVSPAPSPGAVPVARLAAANGRWRIDRKFRPPRIRR